MKKIIFLMIIFALTFSWAMPVLAEQGNNNATSTAPAWGLKKKIAETTDWTCVITAVDKRETAVATAYETKTTAIKLALSNKKTALKEALAKTDSKERIKARNKAWTDYKTAVKSANKTYRDAVNAAWKQYKTDRRACKLNVEAEPVGLELNI